MTDKRKVLSVTPEDAGKRLDVSLSGLCPELTRNRIKSLIEQEMILLDGKSSKPSARLKEGQTIQVAIPESRPVTVEPQSMALDILYEDDQVVVVNKAAGLVVHPAAGNPDRTLVNALLAHCTDLSGIGGELRPGIVHRLDKGTSGVIVAAKNDAAHQSLSEQFASRSITKEYLAVVLGSAKPEKGLWDQPVGRHRSERKKMSVHSKAGKSALTRFELLGWASGVGALKLKIETGRTHQIRVHCKHAGRAVAGDDLYGGLKKIKQVTDPELSSLLHALEFPALHAWRLVFSHPKTDERISIVAPLRDEMKAIFDKLGALYE